MAGRYAFFIYEFCPRTGLLHGLFFAWKFIKAFKEVSIASMEASIALMKASTKSIKASTEAVEASMEASMEAFTVAVEASMETSVEAPVNDFMEAVKASTEKKPGRFHRLSAGSFVDVEGSSFRESFQYLHGSFRGSFRGS